MEHLCRHCKNACWYKVVTEGQKMPHQRFVCIVTADRLAPSERVIECTFYVPFDADGPRHYS